MFHIPDDLEQYISPTAVMQLQEYFAALQTWNQRINLIAKGDASEQWQRHIVNSCEMLPILPVDPCVIADMGSGAGLPGVVIAITTQHQVHLIEADQKKGAFIHHVKRLLNLANMHIHGSRIEQTILPPLDMVTARALAPLSKLIEFAEVLSSNTKQTMPASYLFMKGERVDEELGSARKQWTISECHRIQRQGSATTIIKIRGCQRVHIDT